MFDLQEVEQLRGLIRDEVRPVVREEVTASEMRLEKKITLAIAGFIDDVVVPQFDRLDRRMEAFERKFGSRPRAW